MALTSSDFAFKPQDTAWEEPDVSDLSGGDIISTPQVPLNLSPPTPLSFESPTLTLQPDLPLATIPLPTPEEIQPPDVPEPPDPTYQTKLDSYLRYGSTFPGHSDSTDSENNKEFNQILDIPNWGIKDFIRERSIWQKGVESLSGEPGWFYFKIFFKFNTSYGLLGGALEDSKSINTAAEYLWNCNNTDTFNDTLYTADIDEMRYGKSQISSRLIALLKFIGTLSYINENAPWFFNSISGLNKANSVKLSEPFKNNEIEIGVREDAVDMRLTTLFELYKYACFDNVNLKEIVPENLRKFDMSIIVFHTPLRYYQTGFQSMKNGTHEYKSLNAKQLGNRMSYIMYTFSNCEFDLDSINNIMPGEMSNETAFNIGKSSFKINYKRVYRHVSNEWSKLFFGDGSYFEDEDESDYSTQQERLAAMNTALENLGYYNRTADIYKSMVDAVEKEANDIMRAVDPSMALGNLYWSNIYSQSRQEDLNSKNSSFFGTIKNSIDKVKSTANAIFAGGADTSMGVGSKYFNAQLNLLKYGDESLHGPNPYEPGTPYFTERVKSEKHGDCSLHDHHAIGSKAKNLKLKNFNLTKNGGLFGIPSNTSNRKTKIPLDIGGLTKTKTKTPLSSTGLTKTKTKTPFSSGGLTKTKR